jgi:hypothetical protein
MVIGRDREGFGAAGFGRGMERPPYVFLGASPQKRVALRATRCLAAVRLAAMLVCLVCDIG